MDTIKEAQSLVLDATDKTPQVDLSALTGELILSGRSIPENASVTFDPILKWVNEYRKNPKPVTNLRLNLEYFNTSSSIWIAKIIKSLAQITQTDYVLFIHLYFSIEEFDDMEGEDIKEALTPITDIACEASVSIGVKIYGTDTDGVILKENMILI
jgi:hypothetical protein